MRSGEYRPRERTLFGLLENVPVNSPTRITPENNGKIRPQPDWENAFVRASGGSIGIRTLETVPRLHTFQACAFDHSATDPLRGVIGIGSRVARGAAALPDDEQEGFVQAVRAAIGQALSAPNGMCRAGTPGPTAKRRIDCFCDAALTEVSERPGGSVGLSFLFCRSRSDRSHRCAPHGCRRRAADPPHPPPHQCGSA